MGKLLRPAYWVVVVAILALFVAGLFRSGDQSGSEPTRFASSPRDVPIPVEVYEYGFNPTNTVIAAGQAVAFRNVGEELHEIRPLSAAGTDAFQEAQQFGSARPIFREPGVYPIYCTIHPDRMRAKITVREDLASVEPESGG